MSSAYAWEPATSARAVVRTTVGDVDVELWAREAPRAVRRWVRTALMGGYDGAPFHRVVPGLLVQSGKVAGPAAAAVAAAHAAEGARPPERHSRLRFRYRGVLAAAAAADDDAAADASQWFFTLAAAPHLDGQHAILGKAVGASVFTLLRIGELEVDANDCPVDPVVVRRVDVLEHPFAELDGVARIVAASQSRQVPGAQAAAAPGARRVPRAVRSQALLSFNDGEEDVDEDDDGFSDERKAAGATAGSRVISSHEALDDPRLSKSVAVSETHPVRTIADARDDVVAADTNPESPSPGPGLGPSVDPTKPDAGDRAERPPIVAEAPRETPVVQTDAAPAQKTRKRGRPGDKLPERPGEAPPGAAGSLLEARRAQYLQKRGRGSTKASEREATTLAKLRSFTARLSGEDALTFPAEPGAAQRNEDGDGYSVEDPRARERQGRSGDRGVTRAGY